MTKYKQIVLPPLEEVKKLKKIAVDNGKEFGPWITWVLSCIANGRIKIDKKLK